MISESTTRITRVHNVSAIFSLHLHARPNSLTLVRTFPAPATVYIPTLASNPHIRQFFCWFSQWAILETGPCAAEGIHIKTDSAARIGSEDVDPTIYHVALRHLECTLVRNSSALRSDAADSIHHSPGRVSQTTKVPSRSTPTQTPSTPSPLKATFPESAAQSCAHMLGLSERNLLLLRTGHRRLTDILDRLDLL